MTVPIGPGCLRCCVSRHAALFCSRHVADPGKRVQSVTSLFEVLRDSQGD
jgi:hypothetical protein